MAANDRSIERMQARKDAGINDELALKLQNFDTVCQDAAGNAESLCRAIKRIASARSTADNAEQARADLAIIGKLAQQAAYWSFDLGNEINVFVGELGCTHVEGDRA